MKLMKKLTASLFVVVLCVSMAVAPTAAFAASASSSSSASSAASKSSKSSSADAASKSSSASASSSSSSAASSSSASSESSSASSVTPAAAGTYVFDEAGLFTEAELAELNAQGAELAQKYNMGVYFLTTDYMNGLADPSSSQRTDYATTYYKQHSLGLNPTDGKNYGDGIMFVLAKASRDYVTIAYGQGSYSFSDAGIESLEKAVLDNISDHRDNWYGAASTYYSEVGSQLAYYDRHGKAQQPIGLVGYLIRFAIILGIPAIITFVVINGWRNSMKTAREQSEASQYLDPASLQVTRSEDEFVNTTLIATPKPKDNDSGGGGGWGGGGGGGFSSSGGGKF